MVHFDSTAGQTLLFRSQTRQTASPNKKNHTQTQIPVHHQQDRYYTTTSLSLATTTTPRFFFPFFFFFLALLGFFTARADVAFSILSFSCIFGRFGFGICTLSCFMFHVNNKQQQQRQRQHDLVLSYRGCSHSSVKWFQFIHNRKQFMCCIHDTYITIRKLENRQNIMIRT